MHPFAFNPDVGLIHPPTVVGWFESPTQTLFHFRAIALDPPPDGDVIGAQAPLSASNSSTSRYEREKRKYHPTASRMTSGSNCRHLNKPQTEEARRSIRPAYHGLPVKLQHCRGELLIVRLIVIIVPRLMLSVAARFRGQHSFFLSSARTSPR